VAWYLGTSIDFRSCVVDFVVELDSIEAESSDLEWLGLRESIAVRLSSVGRNCLLVFE